MTKTINKKTISHKKMLSELEILVDYTYADEADHYEENNKPAAHVFRSILILEKYLKQHNK